MFVHVEEQATTIEVSNFSPTLFISVIDSDFNKDMHWTDKKVIQIINVLREIEMNTVTGKPEDKKLLGRSRHRRKNNIKVDLKEISCEDVFWIHVTQNWVRWRPTVVSCSSETKHDKGKAPRPKLYVSKKRLQERRQ
jgi:hypothetical protein